MVDQYQAAVNEGRRLIKQSEADQWRLAQLTWENASPIEGDGKNSLAQWAKDLGIDKSRQHITTLYYLWEQWGTQAGLRPFHEVYRMTETHTETPEEASIVKDKNRAKSALLNLPPAAQKEVFESVTYDNDEQDKESRALEDINLLIAGIRTRLRQIDGLDIPAHLHNSTAGSLDDISKWAAGSAEKLRSSIDDELEAFLREADE